MWATLALKVHCACKEISYASYEPTLRNRPRQGGCIGSRLASNPHFKLTQQVEELAQRGKGDILAEFHGTLRQGIPSLGPPYPVDGPLIVERTITIESGAYE